MNNNRREYKSLDEMAQYEGVYAVLDFLAYNPTVIMEKGGKSHYRHTIMETVPFTVKKSGDPDPTWFKPSGNLGICSTKPW